MNGQRTQQNSNEIILGTIALVAELETFLTPGSLGGDQGKSCSI